MEVLDTWHCPARSSREFAKGRARTYPRNLESIYFIWRCKSKATKRSSKAQRPLVALTHVPSGRMLLSSIHLEKGWFPNWSPWNPCQNIVKVLLNLQNFHNPSTSTSFGNIPQLFGERKSPMCRCGTSSYRQDCVKTSMERLLWHRIWRRKGLYVTYL